MTTLMRMATTRTKAQVGDEAARAHSGFMLVGQDTGTGRSHFISLTRAQGTPRYKIGSLRGVSLSAYNKKHHNYTSMGPLYVSAADHPDRALLLLCQVDARVDVGVQGPGPGTLRTMPLRRGGDVEAAGTRGPAQVWASLRVLLTTRTTQTTSSFRVRPLGHTFSTAPFSQLRPPCSPHHSIPWRPLATHTTAFHGAPLQPTPQHCMPSPFTSGWKKAHSAPSATHVPVFGSRLQTTSRAWTVPSLQRVCWRTRP